MGHHRIIGTQVRDRAFPFMRSLASRGDGVSFVSFGYRDTCALPVTIASLSTTPDTRTLARQCDHW